jgi:2-oxo-4-hydroxy-4-carboxy-5-ureidoimidazoline decarboxylase
VTTFAALSGLPQAEFLTALDGIYEHSPWVAAAAWPARPFAGLEALGTALADAVSQADEAAKLALLRAHPELAGRAAVRGELTDLSRAEQGRAGLDRCSPEQLSELTRLNDAYAEKFGFPFIIAVRGLAVADIVAAMTRRLGQAADAEMREALAQVDRIALLRLRDRFPEASP